MMKKQSLRKIIASVSLSLCLALSAGVALTNVDSNGYASASTTVVGSDYAAKVTTDAVTSTASIVTDEAQLNLPTSKFTGLKLTGNSDATFNLGSVNIASSNWAGTYTASAPSTATNKNVPFIKIVFAPHDNLDITTATGGSGKGEFTTIDFILSQGNSSITARVGFYNYYDNPSSAPMHEFTLEARANSQAFGAFRNVQGWKGALRKSHILAKDAANLGYSGKLAVNTVGYSEAALPLYYDFNDVALYSGAVWGGSTDTHQLATSYLIRDFDSTEAAYNGGAATWDGFKKDAQGKCMVDVKVKFNAVRDTSPTSVIITELGGVALGNSITLTDEEVSVYPVENNISSAIVGDTVTINVPHEEGCAFTGTTTITDERKVVLSFNGQEIDTLTNVVDNKVSFVAQNPGYYQAKILVGTKYSQVIDITAVSSEYSVSASNVASNLVVSEGASATYGSATSRAGTFNGVVLKGGSNSTFTYQNVDISRLKYNSAGNFNSFISLIPVPSANVQARVIYEDINGDGQITFGDLDIDADGVLDIEENDFDNDGLDDDVDDDVKLDNITYDTDNNPASDNTEEVKFKQAALKRIKELKALTYDVKHGDLYYGRELNSIEVLISEVNDPDKYVTFSMTAAEYREDGYNTGTSIAKARATGQTLSAYRHLQGGNPVAKGGYDKGMCPKDFSFTGLNTNELELIYDNEKVALYSSNAIVHSATGNSQLIRDFNDINAGSSLFEGFSDNVNITVKFGSLMEANTTSSVAKSYVGNLTTPKYFTYVDENGDGIADNEGAITEASVVLTSLFGMDLTKPTSVISAETDELHSKQDKVVGYYGETITAPEIVKRNVYLPSITYSATYKLLDSENNVVEVAGNKLEGEYQVGQVFNINDIGSYKFVVTDTYGLTTTVPLHLNPRVSFDFGANFTAKVNGVSVQDGQTLNVDENVTLTLTPAYGYAISSVVFDGVSVATGEELTFDLADFIGYDRIKVRAEAIDYTITYKMKDDATYNEVKTFNVEDVYDKVALFEPAEVSGKRFVGWFINEDKFETFADIGIKDITVYGVYGPEVYYVTFDLGDGNVSTQIVNKNGNAVAFAPEKEGYVFDGWVDKNGNVYAFNTAVTEDVELVAKWSVADGLQVNDADVTPNDVKATVIEPEKPVNVLQVIFIVLFGLGAAAGIAAGVMFILKKLGKI